MGIACWTMSRRPSQTREEPAKVAPENVDLGDPWPRGFFDCLGDCKACCCGCCCPCYTHAANAVTSKSAPCESESVCGTCCLFCICQPCCPGYCCLAKPTRLAIRNRYLLEERAAGMGCCDGDCCAKWCCCCCSIIQEARTLAYFEGKGNAYVLSKEVAETSNGAAPGESFCLKFKKRVLRGEGDVGMSVLPEPCSDEWKGIMKGVGKFLLMNEEGLFLKCEKDGSVA